MIEPRVADRRHAFPFSPSGADIAFACTKHVEFVLEGARRLTPHRSAAPGTAQHEAFGVCWHRGIAPEEIPAVWIDGERVELTAQDHEAIAFALAWCAAHGFAGRKVIVEKLLRSPWGAARRPRRARRAAHCRRSEVWLVALGRLVQLGCTLLLALEVRRTVEGGASRRS